jgi:hypothetical protein
MAPLIVLVVVSLLARLIGQMGVAHFRLGAASIRVGLAVMLCFTAAAHSSLYFCGQAFGGPDRGMMQHKNQMKEACRLTVDEADGRLRRTQLIGMALALLRLT